jgi:hypothetical protein
MKHFSEFTIIMKFIYKIVYTKRLYKYNIENYSVFCVLAPVGGTVGGGGIARLVDINEWPILWVCTCPRNKLLLLPLIDAKGDELSNSDVGGWTVKEFKSTETFTILSATIDSSSASRSYTVGKERPSPGGIEPGNNHENQYLDTINKIW